MVTYNRPIEAKLWVHLDNGEEPWEATTEDLERFNLVDRHIAYMTFDDALVTLLANNGLGLRDVTDAQLNPVRYLVEIAVAHPALLEHSEHTGWSSVAELEHRLRRTEDLINFWHDAGESARQVLRERHPNLAMRLDDLSTFLGQTVQGGVDDPATEEEKR